MSHVIYDTLNRQQFHGLPKTDPPLEYRDGMVVQEGNGGVIYREITLEQFLRLPEAKPALEYIDGLVVPKVSPNTTHSVLQLHLGAYLLASGQRKKLGLPCPELRCTFGGRSPGQTVKALSARSTWCLSKGVRLCWVIQPRKERVHVFRPGQPAEVLELGDMLSGSAVLPEFALPLEDLFGWLITEE